MHLFHKNRTYNDHTHLKQIVPALLSLFPILYFKSSHNFQSRKKQQNLLKKRKKFTFKPSHQIIHIYICVYNINNRKTFSSNMVRDLCFSWIIHICLNTQAWHKHRYNAILTPAQVWHHADTETMIMLTQTQVWHHAHKHVWH